MMVRKSIFLFLLFSCVASVFSEKRPNIVLFLTDDQDVVLGGMNPMKNVHELIAKKGATFENSYTVSPICCPSRASILTGMYVHNHKTLNNTINGGCNGKVWKEKHEENTFATALETAGYNTFYAGKYLNQYGVKNAGGPEVVPPGWTVWHGLVGNSIYYNYTLSNNGVPTFSEDLYLTDIIRELSLNFIENQTNDRPFLMVLAPPAPHQPFTPAPRHEGKFQNITAMRNPSFNYFAEDKHWLMTMKPNPLPQTLMPYLDESYRKRWESLLAVDEMVAGVVKKLDDLHFLDNTYLIYTSDNGYHIGQFAQVLDKRQPYETDIKIPLVISGPGIKQNTTLSTPVLNIDLAPSILSLAGLQPPPSMDGNVIDFDPSSNKDRFMLVEYFGEGNANTNDESCAWHDDNNLSECKKAYECKCQDSRNNTYACVRHLARNTNFKFCKFEKPKKFFEVYNLNEDPHELTNSYYSTSAVVLEWYSLHLHKLLICQGSLSCNTPIPVDNIVK